MFGGRPETRRAVFIASLLAASGGLCSVLWLTSSARPQAVPERRGSPDPGRTSERQSEPETAPSMLAMPATVASESPGPPLAPAPPLPEPVPAQIEVAAPSLQTVPNEGAIPRSERPATRATKVTRSAKVTRAAKSGEERPHRERKRRPRQG